jgi:hypothetical protein
MTAENKSFKDLIPQPRPITIILRFQPSAISSLSYLCYTVWLIANIFFQTIE